MKAMRQLASGPYGHGSCATEGRTDRRQAVAARAKIAVCCISPAPGILMASAVRPAHFVRSAETGPRPCKPHPLIQGRRRAAL